MERSDHIVILLQRDGFPVLYKIAMAAKTNQKITHILFDVDGLLLDTETIYTTIFSSFMREYGREFTMDLKVRMMGKPAHVALKLLIDEEGLSDVLTVEQAYDAVKQGKKDLFPHAKLKPGVKRLVTHFHKHNIPMALATGSATIEFDLKTTNHKDLLQMISHVVKSDDPDVKQGKPSPDTFQVAASRFDEPPLSPCNVLVFEDAPNGVKAAKAADMNVVMVPEDYVDKSKCTEADLVITSLELFDPSVWGLPPFDL